MRVMRWSYEQLMELPADYLPVLYELMEEWKPKE
jgi:hypothetical protein